MEYKSSVRPVTGALLRMSKLAGRDGLIGVSKSTIWAWVARGQFPRPVRIGRRVTAWREEDIANFIGGKRSIEFSGDA